MYNLDLVARVEELEAKVRILTHTLTKLNPNLDPLIPFVDERDYLVYRTHVISLTPTQACICRLLCRNLDEVVPKEKVIHVLYGDDPEGGPEAKTLDVIMCQLRKKLEHTPLIIETVWGRGFALLKPNEAYLGKRVKTR